MPRYADIIQDYSPVNPSLVTYALRAVYAKWIYEMKNLGINA